MNARRLAYLDLAIARSNGDVAAEMVAKRRLSQVESNPLRAAAGAMMVVVTAAAAIFHFWG